MIDAQIELVVFDADGTLRYVTVPDQHYPVRHSEWALMPGVLRTMAKLPVARLKFGIASNQHGVALQQLSRALAEELLLAAWRAAFDLRAPPVSIEMCTCLPDAICHRRKPEPGMLASLIRKYGVSPANALFVGDLPIDAAAASNAGMRFAWAADFFR